MNDESNEAMGAAEQEVAGGSQGTGLGSEGAGSGAGLTDATEVEPHGLFTPGQPVGAGVMISVVLLATMLIIGGIYVASPDDLSDTLSQERAGFDEEVNRNMLLGYKTPFLSPGVMEPEIWPAGDIRFAGGCPVVGVTVGESHRAYPMITLLPSFTLEGENGAIVNDSLGGMLITVTNDSDAGLVRVFRLAAESRRKTISMWLLGRDEKGGILLTLDKEGEFRQDLKEVPDLADHPFTTGTLAEWRAEHPGTDVYVGQFSTVDVQMESTLPFMTTDERIEADRVLEERKRKRKILSPKSEPRPATEPKAQQPPGAAARGPQGKTQSRINR